MPKPVYPSFLFSMDRDTCECILNIQVTSLSHAGVWRWFIIVRLFSEKLLNFFSRCSLENVTMENKELTVIKEDNGTTPNLSISNRVRLFYMVFQKYHSAD